MALPGEALPLLQVVRERLHLHLDHRVPPVEDRLDGLPPGRLQAVLRAEVVLHLEAHKGGGRRQHRHSVAFQLFRCPVEGPQRVLQRPHGVLVADDELDAEDVLHEAVQVAQLLIQVDEAVEVEDGVYHLVPDLLFRLDATHHLVDAPVVDRLGVILDDVRDERRRTPAFAVEVAEASHLPAAEVEVGQRVEIVGGDVLHQREALLRGIHAADGQALQRIAPVEERVARELAEAVQPLLATADHSGKGTAHLVQAGAAEGDGVLGVGRFLDRAPHLIEIDHQVVHLWFVGDEPQGRHRPLFTSRERIGPSHRVASGYQEPRHLPRNDRLEFPRTFVDWRLAGQR